MKIVNHLAFAVLLSGLSATAMAQTESSVQLYTGLGLGEAEYVDACEDNGGISCDEKDTSWKLFVGAQLNEYLAFEFKYHDFGEAEAKAAGVKGGVKAKSVGLDVLPQIPLTESLSLYARLGVSHAKIKGTGVIDGSDHNFTANYGFGVQYDITSNIAIRAEYETMRNLGDNKEELGEHDVDFIGISGLYKF